MRVTVCIHPNLVKNDAQRNAVNLNLSNENTNELSVKLSDGRLYN